MVGPYVEAGAQWKGCQAVAAKQRDPVLDVKVLEAIVDGKVGVAGYERFLHPFLNCDQSHHLVE